MLHVHILSPEKKLFQGKAQMIGLPGEDGRFQILPNHAPIVASLGDGDIKLQDEAGNDKFFHIHSGFVEVLNNTVNILVQGAKVLETE